MVIQWDVDGVLANFQKGYHKRANEMFDTDIPLDFVPPTWDWLEQKLGPRQSRQLWENIKQDPNFWYRLEPRVSNLELARIDMLFSDHDIYFVTSRPGRFPKRQTEDWLVKHMTYSMPTVIVSDRKADAALTIKPDYVIDDKAGNVVMIYYQCYQTKVYIMDAPYNQFRPEVIGQRIRRVSTVTQFLDDIEARR